MLSTGGLYAPTIRYHNGTVYIVCTNVIRVEMSSESPIADNTENFIISTHDIWSNKWSDPIYFDFNGIDPSIFVDDDEKVYIHGSRSPGPSTEIDMFQIDLSTGKKLSEQKKVWGGTGGIYPEGPHLYKYNGFYHLMISEGGTHSGHMITCARSKVIWGPYIGFEGNPILTAWNTDEEVQFTGHADFFEGKDGRWWAVCLGVRLDEGRIVMGRETFLTAGSWSGCGWPRIDTVKMSPAAGIELSWEKKHSSLISAPGVDYLYIRDPTLSNFEFSPDGHRITLTATENDFDQWKNPITFVRKRQRNLIGQATVVMTISHKANNINLQSGMAYYKDEYRYMKLYYDHAASEIVLQVVNRAKAFCRVTKRGVKQSGSYSFRIQYTPRSYVFSYNMGQNWLSLEPLDTLILSGLDFVGPVIGVFAIGDADNSKVVCNDLEIL